MPSPLFRLVCLMVLVHAATGDRLHAADHAHEHAAPATQAPTQLELNKGKKWPTDKALRASMSTLRDNFAAQIHAIHAGTLAPAHYKKLGAAIDTEIAHIVANCKLEPKADATLHILLSDLGAAASVMQARASGDPGSAAHRAVTALNSYGRYFNHPHWKDLK